ncbi:MAG TPA: NAD(P)H-dependent glycerol-3-phosphate dehydrogenase, partial [Gemmatimonadales bacterium]|nr:NAD(P)H-dependent glycerol-3-phosphate dehydrogenase [Gemmatimonadales bacterium]
HPPPAQRNREPLRAPRGAVAAGVTAIAVLGAGSWGTTLADLLARKGDRVRLWAYEPEVVEAVNRGHENPLFLPGVRLAPALSAIGDAREAVAGAEVIVSAAPSHALRAVLGRLEGAVPAGTLVVSATKGIETDTLLLMTAVVTECLPGTRVAAISGPSFAAEVCEGQPTAVVAAARDPATAEAAQRVFATPTFRVYRNLDVIGVELGGALKNVIAIAAGILEGLGLGHNPRAALITRGLAEISRLGVAMGADPLTFAGLAGMGDLVLTATGGLSRNRALGVALGRGESFEAYRAAHRSVAEGANASHAGAALGERHGVELPITRQVCDVLFRGKPARDGVAELMTRELKSEQWR